MLASVTRDQRVFKCFRCLASDSVVALLTPLVCAYYLRKLRHIHPRLPCLRRPDPSSNVPTAFLSAITTVCTLLLRRPQDACPRSALSMSQQLWGVWALWEPPHLHKPSIVRPSTRVHSRRGIDCRRSQLSDPANCILRFASAPRDTRGRGAAWRSLTEKHCYWWSRRYSGGLWFGGC